MHYHLATQTRALNDAPFEWALKWLGGADFDRAVVIVRGRAKDRLGCSAWDWINDSCLQNDTVEQVLRCYSNAAFESKIPEYNPQVRSTIDAVLTFVTKCSGTDWETCHAIIYELYEATREGQISSSLIAFPKSGQVYEKERTAPAHVDTEDSPLGTALKWGKWGLILGVVGLGIYELNTVTGVVGRFLPGRKS